MKSYKITNKITIEQTAIVPNYLLEQLNKLGFKRGSDCGYYLDKPGRNKYRTSAVCKYEIVRLGIDHNQLTVTHEFWDNRDFIYSSVTTTAKDFVTNTNNPNY